MNSVFNNCLVNITKCVELVEMMNVPHATTLWSIRKSFINIEHWLAQCTWRNRIAKLNKQTNRRMNERTNTHKEKKTFSGFGNYAEFSVDSDSLNANIKHAMNKLIVNGSFDSSKIQKQLFTTMKTGNRLSVERKNKSSL